MLAMFAGTRSDIIRLAPIYHEMRRLGQNVEFIVVGARFDLMVLSLKEESIVPNIVIKIGNQESHLGYLNTLLQHVYSFPFNQYHAILINDGSTTALAVAHSAFLQGTGIKIFHVNAGYRTQNRLSPFPEETNRRLISQLVSAHFSPTATAALNLHERKVGGVIQVTGSTTIDSFRSALTLPDPAGDSLIFHLKKLLHLIVINLNRPETQTKLNLIIAALNQLDDNYNVVWPVVPDPQFTGHLTKIDNNRVCVMPSIEHSTMARFIKNASLVITDSSLIAEEATDSNKPCLILRDAFDIPDILDDGCKVFSLSQLDRLSFNELAELITSAVLWKRSPSTKNVLGDGEAARRISETIHNLYE